MSRSTRRKENINNFINHVHYLIIAPRIKGMLAIWNVSRQPSLSTNEPELKLPIKAPTINILTTSPSMKEFPSKPSSRAMETIGPFMTLQNMQSSLKWVKLYKKLETQTRSPYSFKNSTWYTYHHIKD